MMDIIADKDYKPESTAILYKTLKIIKQLLSLERVYSDDNNEQPSFIGFIIKHQI